MELINPTIPIRLYPTKIIPPLDDSYVVRFADNDDEYIIELYRANNQEPKP
jgi:hypothetical protein